MSKDNIIKLIQPGNVDDQLTEILRNGARALLAQAVEAEVADFLGKHADLKTADGHQRVVRHGYLPEREVMTGIGPVAVRQPRVRDREADATDPDRIRFSPSILPPYMRRSKSIETLLPILYLKGISTGDFSEALAALLGKDAAGLSAGMFAAIESPLDLLSSPRKPRKSRKEPAAGTTARGHVPLSIGGRGYLPRPWTGMAQRPMPAT